MTTFQLPGPTPVSGWALIMVTVFLHIFILSEIFTPASDADEGFVVKLAALSVTDLARLLSLSVSISKLTMTATTAMPANDDSIHFFLMDGTKTITNTTELIKMAIPDNHDARVCERTSDTI